MKKKVPLARNIRWWKRVPFLEAEPVARCYLRATHFDSRDIKGELGKTLLAIGEQGKATFLDAPPRDVRGHVMVVGYANGIVVNYFKDFGLSWSWTMQMCTTFRNKIVGGNGKVRWAKLKAVTE